jgi:hypothetical protein
VILFLVVGAVLVVVPQHPATFSALLFFVLRSSSLFFGGGTPVALSLDVFLVRFFLLLFDVVGTAVEFLELLSPPRISNMPC